MLYSVYFHARMYVTCKRRVKSAAKLLIFCDIHKGLGKNLNEKEFFANRR